MLFIKVNGHQRVNIFNLQTLGLILLPPLEEPNKPSYNLNYIPGYM
jgi:hypothetical protein